MQSPTYHLHRFFFTPQDSAPLSFLRIAVGLFGLFQTALLAGSWLNIYGVNGFVEWFISDDLFNIKALPSIIRLADWLMPYGIQDNTTVLAVTALYVAALIGVTLGWRTRPMIFLAWITHFMICNTAMAFGYGMETFMHIALFYLLFSPCAEYLSLDARAGRSGFQRQSAQAGLMIRVLQLHLCLVYFNAGIAKMQGADWMTGEAIWYIFGNTNYSQFDLHFIAEMPIISKILSWWTLLIETGYPLFMFWKRTRFFWWIHLILLHIGIAIFMGLYLFALIMILHNVAAFGWVVIPDRVKVFFLKKGQPCYQFFAPSLPFADTVSSRSPQR